MLRKLIFVALPAVFVRLLLSAGSSRNTVFDRGSRKHAGGTVSGSTYIVAAGDTFYSIGQRFGLPYQEILRANNLAEGASVGAGHRLNIPGLQPTVPPITPPVKPPPVVTPPPAKPPSGRPYLSHHQSHAWQHAQPALHRHHHRQWCQSARQQSSGTGQRHARANNRFQRNDDRRQRPLARRIYQWYSRTPRLRRHHPGRIPWQ